MTAMLKPAHRARQLALFPPVRQAPSWESMPPEVQHQVARLLVRMLRDHAARYSGAVLPEEDGDE